MSTTALVTMGNDNIVKCNKLPFIYGSDLPKNSDIKDVIAKNKELKPYILEERPTIVDLKTGDRVLIDQYIKDKLGTNICYLA